MSISKRKRSIKVTSWIATVLVLVLLIVFFSINKRNEKQYDPGEPINGVTVDLYKPVPKNHPEIEFKDMTKIAGIDFTHFSGKRTEQLPEDMGSGASWIDYDQDGNEDLVIVNQSGPLTMTADEIKKSAAHCELYHNNGNGTFTKVTEASGLNFHGCGMGVAVGDVDNDGFPDVFITSFGKNIFYHNNGNGTFSDQTKKQDWVVRKDSGLEPVGQIMTGMDF